MMQDAFARGGGADYKGAIGHGLGNGLEFFRFPQQFRSANGGASLAECDGVGIHQAQPMRAEVAHGTGSRADVEGVARTHEYNDETVQSGRQGVILR